MTRILSYGATPAPLPTYRRCTTRRALETSLSTLHPNHGRTVRRFDARAGERACSPVDPKPRRLMTLDVAPIVRANDLAFDAIFQHLTHFSRRTDWHGQTLIHLRRVPIDFRERENLFGNLRDRTFAAGMRAQQQRPWHVRAGICAVIGYAAVGVEKAFPIQLNECPPKHGVICPGASAGSGYLAFSLCMRRLAVAISA